MKSNDPIVIKTDTQRNPFEIISVSLLGALCRGWYANLPVKGKKWQAKFCRALFTKLVKAGYQSSGRCAYAIRGQSVTLKFNAANTQFNSLYLPKYAALYEPEIALVLDKVIPSEGVFYDVGANFGYFSLYIASRPDFKGQVYAFEPNPDTFHDLESMIAQAGLQDVILPHCLGGYFEKKETYVRSSGARSGNFTLLDETGRRRGSCRIQLDRLDNLDGAPLPDAIKIDTEGSEGDVLRGLTGIWAHKKPYIVFESTLYKHACRKTMDPFLVLQDQGYHFYYLGFLQPLEGEEYIVRSAEEDFDGKKDVLLYPLKAEERFLLEERCNVLAVHESAQERFRTLCSQ